MSRALITELYLTNIANAIRAKKGSDDTYTPPQMAAAIGSIESYPEPTGDVAIRQNGVVNVKDYATADVSVPNSYTLGDEGKVVKDGALVGQSGRNIVVNGRYNTTTNNEVIVNVAEGGSARVIPKNISANGNYDASSDNVDGYSSVNVNVPNTYGVGDEGKVVKNGALIDQTPRNVTANGTYDTTENNSTVVNVPNTYGAGDEGKVVSGGELVAQTPTTKNANGTYDTTENNQVVINVPNSYTAGDEGKVVSGGALVPQSARSSEITVNGTYDTTNNNSVKVNVAGSSAVLITKTISVNGQYSASSDNADGYSSVDVNVPNTYTAADEGKVVDNGALVAQTARPTQITENGTYDTTNNNSVEVNVSGGGGTLISKTITQNGVYNASADAADGYSSIIAQIPTGFIGFVSTVSVVSSGV